MTPRPDHAVTHTAQTFTDVRVLRFQRRRGFCAAVNAGIRAARHPIVELLNDDTEVTAGWAEAALARFADPRLAAVAPLVLRGSPGEREPSPLSIDSAGDRYFLGGIAGKRGHGQPISMPAICKAAKSSAPALPARSIAAHALLDVGAFPEEFGSYFEDVDVAFRLHWAGHRIVYEPASRVWHRVSASHGRPTRRLLEQQSRNEERVFWRNLPRHDLLRALPWHAAVLAAKACRRWQHGELLPFVFGRLRAFRRSQHSRTSRAVTVVDCDAGTNRPTRRFGASRRGFGVAADGPVTHSYGGIGLPIGDIRSTTLAQLPLVVLDRE